MCLCNNFPSEMFSSVQKWKVWWRVLWKTEFSLWTGVLSGQCWRINLLSGVFVFFDEMFRHSFNYKIDLLRKALAAQRNFSQQGRRSNGCSVTTQGSRGVSVGLHWIAPFSKNGEKSLLKTGFDCVFFAQMTFGSFTKSSHHASPLMLLASLIMASTF